MHAPTSDLAIFWIVVGVRFLLPLSIPRFPLPGVLACLVVDGIDQSVFQTFTHLDLAHYQGYDKALDIFYLSIAMLSIYRNWNTLPAAQIGRVLFYARLIGVMAFELGDWRPLLFLLPNTFEFFFIFYEAVRSRWDPTRLSHRYYAGAAAVIWLAKLPQEYWIHIAKLDFTDVLKRVVFGAALTTSWPTTIARRPIGVALVLGSLGVLWLVARAAIRRFGGPPSHALTLAAEPLPRRIDEAHERDRSIARRWRLFDVHLVEKIALVGLVTVIFAQIVPGVTASPAQLVLGTAAIVTINTFLRLRRAREGRSLESAALSFWLLALTNTVIVATANRLLHVRGGGLDVLDTMFFLLLLTLVVTLYDLWRPVFETRFASERRR